MKNDESAQSEESTVTKNEDIILKDYGIEDKTDYEEINAVLSRYVIDVSSEEKKTKTKNTMDKTGVGGATNHSATQMIFTAGAVQRL